MESEILAEPAYTFILTFIWSIVAELYYKVQ